MLATKKQILIVDRDVALVGPLCDKLREAGFAVSTVTSGTAAIKLVADQPPDLLIIDWDMPGFAVYELLQTLRRRALRVVRLVICSELAGEEHIVMGLNLGADDYITKPYGLREVVARVSVLLRPPASARNNMSLNIDDLVVNLETNRVTAQGNVVNLRGVEFRLLEFFMANSGRTFNRNQLLVQVWGSEGEVDERTVDVNVQRLRKILSAQGYESYIQTVRGFGYRFARPSVNDAN